MAYCSLNAYSLNSIESNESNSTNVIDLFISGTISGTLDIPSYYRLSPDDFKKPLLFKVLFGEDGKAMRCHPLNPELPTQFIESIEDATKKWKLNFASETDNEIIIGFGVNCYRQDKKPENPPSVLELDFQPKIMINVFLNKPKLRYMPKRVSEINVFVNAQGVPYFVEVLTSPPEEGFEQMAEMIGYLQVFQQGELNGEKSEFQVRQIIHF